MASPHNTSEAWVLGWRARLNKTGAYYIAFITLGLSTAYLGPTLPGLAAHIHTSIQAISALFLFSSLGYMFGTMLGGRLFDRLAGHPLLIGVLLISTLAMFSIPLLPLLWLLAGVLLVQGIMSGLLDVGINTLIVWVHRDEMGPFMNGLHFFFGIGTFVSPIIIAWAVTLSGGNIHYPFWALAVLMLPSVFILTRLPSPQPVTARDSAPERPILPVVISLLALFNLCYVGSEISFGGWIFTYAVQLHHAPETLAAYLTSGFWGAFTVGRLISVPLALRVSPRKVLLFDLLLALTGLAIIQLIPGSYPALWVGVIVVGLGMASIFPTVILFADKLMSFSSRVASFIFVGGSLGGMFLPWLIGQLFTPVGPPVVMLAISVFLSISLLLLVGILVYTRRKALPVSGPGVP